MPRCFFFFTLNNTGKTVRISSIKEGEDYSYFRKDQKVGKDLTYNVSGVPKSLLKSVLISNVLLPFNMGKLPCAVLPIEKNNNKWQEIDSARILSFKRSVINHFNKIKRDYKATKHKDDMYGNTLNMWNKLEQQQLQRGKYLVVYGAGGKNICSAYMLIDNPDKYVIDQTLYWAMVDTEEEAIYLSAILNCPTLNDAIAAFQPQGVFGERHVHTLPVDFIPRYNQEDSRHVELVNEAKILFHELYSELSIDFIDPNKGMLSSRRKKVSQILCSLPSYTLYVTLCESILYSEIDNGADEDSAVHEPKTHIVEMYPQYEEEEEMMMAAEPFECYKWNRFEQNIIDFFGGDKTILVGCTKSKKQKEWILAHNIYNVRLGKTKGSTEEHRDMFGRTSLLILYEFGKPEKISVYNVVDHKEMGKEELMAMDYPNKNPRKSYMTFNIEPLEMNLSLLANQHLIEKLIEINPENTKGAPVFIEP